MKTFRTQYPAALLSKLASQELPSTFSQDEINMSAMSACRANCVPPGCLPALLKTQTYTQCRPRQCPWEARWCCCSALGKSAFAVSRFCLVAADAANFELPSRHKNSLNSRKRNVLWQENIKECIRFASMMADEIILASLFRPMRHKYKSYMSEDETNGNEETLTVE
jgi:hypothetical protein